MELREGKRRRGKREVGSGEIGRVDWKGKEVKRSEEVEGSQDGMGMREEGVRGVEKGRRVLGVEGRKEGKKKEKKMKRLIEKQKEVEEGRDGK